MSKTFARPVPNVKTKKPLINFFRPGLWQEHFIVGALQDVTAAIPKLERDGSVYPYLQAVYPVQQAWEECQPSKLKEVFSPFKRDYNPEDKHCLPRIILEFSGAHITEPTRSTFITVLRFAAALAIPPEKFKRYVRENGGPRQLPSEQRRSTRGRTRLRRRPRKRESLKFLTGHGRRNHRNGPNVKCTRS